MAEQLPLHHDGLSRPLENPQLRVLSLGAGVQSSCLAIMADAGEFGPKPDCAIFADTGAEPSAVYEHLDALRRMLSFPVHIVSAGSLYEELMSASRGEGESHGRPPLFVDNGDGSVGMLRRQCTGDYKIDPIRKKVRELIGLKPRQRAPKVAVVEQWIGISTDEVWRLSESRNPFIHLRHPLIEARMDRRACQERLLGAGLSPPKSACTFCPYRSDAGWSELKRQDPSAFAQAVEVDDGLRSGKFSNLLTGTLFVHRSLRPLSEVSFDPNSDQAAFGFANECEGMCGV